MSNERRVKPGQTSYDPFGQSKGVLQGTAIGSPLPGILYRPPAHLTPISPTLSVVLHQVKAVSVVEPLVYLTMQDGREYSTYYDTVFTDAKALLGLRDAEEEG